MPLSEPVARELRHTRDIRVQGFHRSDGLFDIEAHLVDRRAQAFPTLDRGVIPADGLLHEMWVRMTVDRDMRITDCAAVTDNAPFAICPGGAASFARLAGLTVKPGFLKAANERVGGTAGCTHIRELLQQMATVAFQTVWSVHASPPAGEAPSTDRATTVLNTCHAYASGSDVVRRRWPALYTGTAQMAEAGGD